MSELQDRKEKLVIDELSLLLAEQQLRGFAHAIFNSEDIAGLVVCMGLTSSEWEELKSNDNVPFLTEGMVHEIDDHFAREVEQK